MSTMTERTAHVKPERLPFRPLLHAPEMSWAVAEDGRLSVFVKKGRREDCYHVFPLHTDLGGVAYRWHKLDGSGTVHDLTINGEHSSCSCEGWAYTDSLPAPALHAGVDRGGRAERRPGVGGRLARAGNAPMPT